jgi:hypothetical protein
MTKQSLVVFNHEIASGCALAMCLGNWRQQ